MIGTLINAVAVVAGGTVGCILGDRMPARVRETVMGALGLTTLAIGMEMAIKTRNGVIVIVSLVFGSLLGDWMGIEALLERVGRFVETRMAGASRTASADPAAREGRSVARAFVTSSLVFCVGPMTILGAIQDGMVGDRSLLLVKSALDMFTSIAFAAALGPGVVAAAITVLVYQGAISGAAMVLAGALGSVTRESPAVIEMTATGGVLILGIGVLLLDLRRLRVANMLPAVFIAPALAAIVAALTHHR